MRTINHYGLDSQDNTILAWGHTVWDMGIARRIRRGVEFNLTINNLADRLYWETQNYYESRIAGETAASSRIHATPGYPLTVMAGITVRFGGK